MNLELKDTEKCLSIKSFFYKMALIVALLIDCSSSIAQKQTQGAGFDNTSLGKMQSEQSNTKLRLIQGIVTDIENQPMVGANIVVKDANSGTISDQSGKFSIMAADDAALSVSYFGYTNQIKSISGKDYLEFVLTEKINQLEEVIIVAYGTSKRSSFTGSSATIKSEKLQKLQATSLVNALEGVLAGVHTIGASGQPGVAPLIQVRGISSVNAGSAPLYVVDGVPFEGAVNTINPIDVESVTVLKDAAAAALYGARGGNGVILINTKKGKDGEMRISLNTRLGVNSPGISQYDKITNPADYYEIYWEALRNKMVFANKMSYVQAGQYATNNLIFGEGGLNYNSYNVAAKELINPQTGRINPNATLLYKDSWEDEMFNQGLRQEYQMSLSGGNKKSDYFLSFGFLDDQGYVVKSNFERYSARLNMNHQFNSWLKVGGNMNYSRTTTNAPITGSSSSSSMFAFVNEIAPIFPVYRRAEDGSYLLDKQGQRIPDFGDVGSNKRPFKPQANPIGTQELDLNKTETSAFSGRGYAEISFLKDFSLRANIGYDDQSANGVVTQNPIYGQGATDQVQGELVKSTNQIRTFYQNVLLNYNRRVGKHEFDAMVGHESTLRENAQTRGKKRKFFLDDASEFNGAIILESLTGESSIYAVEGYLSRMNYNFDNKYYISGSYRRDGSSRFKKENRWGNFWSVSGAWRISEEQFMMNTQQWLNNLRLKVSYGTQGNDNIWNDVPYLSLYSVTNNNNDFALQQIFQGNDNLTWEKNHNFNAGVEFSLFNRLNASVEYFTRKSTDLLFLVPKAPSTGVNFIPENVGDMINRGIEIELDYQIVNTKDWSLNVALNATHYNNKLLRLPEANRESGLISGNRLMREGKSIYNLYMYDFAGVNPNNGDALYWADEKDAAGVLTGNRIKVNQIGNATRYEVGTSIPKLYGALSASLRYKQFDMDVITNYQLGGQMIDDAYMMSMGDPRVGFNYHQDIFKRWTPDNRYTDVPRVQDGNNGATAVASTRFLTDASYFNIKNISIGYTVPREITQKVMLNNVRVYLAGDNLFLLTARKGLDARQGIFGSSNLSTYLAAKTISFGLNLTF